MMEIRRRIAGSAYCSSVSKMMFGAQGFLGLKLLTVLTPSSQIGILRRCVDGTRTPNKHWP